MISLTVSEIPSLLPRAGDLPGDRRFLKLRLRAPALNTAGDGGVPPHAAERIRELDDFNLVQLSSRGNSAAFSELYERHATFIHSVALKILADPDEAKDVVQHVFLKLHQKSHLYDASKGRPAAWLSVMARNRALDRLREIKRRYQLGEKFHAESGFPAGAPRGEMDDGMVAYAAHSDAVELLDGALKALRPEEHEVLHLAYFGGCSQLEISTRLSQPLGTVKARIRRGLKKLRQALDGIF